jgi:hypothetical protein
MTFIVGNMVAGVALVAVYRFVLSPRRRRRGLLNPLSQVFGVRELRELDAHLDRVALVEVRRLEASVISYLAGEVGHVVAILESRHGVALGLSDGRRLALGGVNHSTLRLVARRAAGDKLRPTRVDRESLSYRLLLRGEGGVEIELHTRRLALAP